ncbi:MULTISPECIES: hypothetical protein [Halorussus]|uniref:hypothetical protein n=1 Tax=Halorussus TaxID=1070314 RepID=UPI00209D7244|nr:hypothetical protein [Halorussus vallis]USZ74943.1 hypothetical protein NGM07_16070 [Halorussus vallis]
MNLRTRRILAVVFSVLIVTSTLTPAAAALEPPSRPNDATRNALLDSVTDSLSRHGLLPPYRGDGDSTATTTEKGPKQGKGPKNGNGKGSKNGTHPRKGEGPKNGTHPGKGKGPKNGTNPGSGKGPKNGTHPGKGKGPKKGDKGGGPPSWAGGPSSKERGPPEWVANRNTPGNVDNRSHRKNASEALANASVDVTVEENASAVDYRVAAIDALQDAEFAGPGRSVERHRTKALEALDDSLQYVLDANRTTSAELFELDKRASTPPKFAPNVTTLLVRSDRQLAKTAIADAERVAEILRARNVSYDADAVERNLTDARAAYERAERFRGSDRGHAAVSQYRVAWIHAQKALDQLDLASTPNVTITVSEDMAHNESVTYAVRGRVFDVRGHELDPLTLTLNGANRTMALDVNATPGTVGTFSTNLTLDRKVNRITVSATDPNRRWAPDDPDAPPVTGHDTLRLDADGLPEKYERDTAGTAPLDYDSNSSRTGRNESANQVLDGNEDFDEDGVTTYYEYLFELKPHDADTDDDELRDGFEQRFRGVEPLTADTDNDTVSDADEDLDGDGLANLREQNATTSPIRADTDVDELNDSAELTVHGTDPLRPDTDGDGLPDADEVELETDPTVADTDGDGVPDGEETFSTTTKNETVGVAVNVTGNGAIAGGITVRNETNQRVQPESVKRAAASEVLHFESEREFERANLTIDYDETRVEDERDLALYTYNRSLQTYVQLPSSVDATNDTVTGTTPHFSTFTVLNEKEWEAQQKVDPDPRYAIDEDFDDLDGWNCSGDCNGGGGVVVGGSTTAQTFDSATADASTESDESGTLTQENDSSSTRTLSDEILSAKGSTGGRVGTNRLCDDCENPFGPGYPPTTTTETTTTSEPYDPPPGTTIPGRAGGDPIPPSRLTRSVELPADASEITVRARVEGSAKEVNATAQVLLVTDSDTYTVFDVDGEDGERVTNSKTIEKDLTHAAGETLTVRVLALNMSTVRVSYFDVQVTRDTDDDGLSNSLETLGIVTGTNERIYTDPYDADTDGDGIPDGQEVGDKHEAGNGVGRTYYLLNSDPTRVDSDGDVLDDYEERRIWGTNLLDSDSDGDGFGDAVDPRPLVEDTPPSITEVNSDNYNDYVEVSVEDESAVSVEGKPKYDPANFLEDSYWNASKAKVTAGTDGEYRIEFEDHGVLNEPPEEYWINLTDSHGNGYAVKIEVKEGGGAKLAASGVVVGGAVSTPTDPSVLARALIGGVIISVFAGGLYLANEYVPADGETVKNQPTTGVKARYLASDTALPTTVTLATGTVATETDPRTGETIARGHGWKYIAETTTLTTADIRQVLRNNPTVHEHGEGDYTVIGRTDYLEEIVISIVGGTIMTASEQPAYNEECEDTVDITKHDNPEHSIRDEKPIDSVSTLREILENPTKIIDAGSQRYYILRLGPNRVVMAVADTVSEGYHILRTILTGKDGGFFKTIDNAEDEIPKNDKEVVYDDDNDVDC